MKKHILRIALITVMINSLNFMGYAQINYAPAQELGRIKDPALTEISGVASSYKTPGAFWVHNDSGDSPRIFLVDKLGNTLTKGTLTYAKAHDWEDIASFQLKGKSYILIADIGDNSQNRRQYSLYIIEEPQYNPNGSNPDFYPIRRKINFSYDTGSQNCESIAVDVRAKKIILVSKTNYQGSKRIRYVHELPLSVKGDTVTQVAKKIQEFDYINEGTTAMDISNDGKRATVLTVWDGAFEFTRNKHETWVEAFGKAPRRIAIPAGRQNEAICYDINGIDLYSMKEGHNSPIWFYKGTKK